MKTFHRKMWEAKEQGYISEEVWKKLCNQPLEAFHLLGKDHTKYPYFDTLNGGLCWEDTREGETYWFVIYNGLYDKGV